MVVFGGDQVIAENYNRLLYADGKGLLPAAVGPGVGDAAKKESAFGFNPLGYRHPLVAEFRGESDPVTAGLTRALTWQYHKLTLPKDSDGPGRAGVRERRPGGDRGAPHRGKVILVATSADAGWTTWPLHHSYPPVMEQIVLQAAAGRLAERNIRVGQPYDQSFARPAAAAAVTVVTPARAAGRRQAQGRPGASASSTSSRPTSPGPTRSGSARRWRSRSRSPPTPTRPRATWPSSTGPALAERLPGLELRLPDQLARTDPECRVGGPPRRAASPVALRRSCSCSWSNRSWPGSSATTIPSALRLAAR